MKQDAAAPTSKIALCALAGTLAFLPPFFMASAAADVPGATPPPQAETAPGQAATPQPAGPETPPAGASGEPGQGAAEPSLDLKALETRLRETEAIGFMTKLTLKNQVDELLERFRAYYEGRGPVEITELRQPFDTLILKVLALLQDRDPPLADAVAASREALWRILTDPVAFSKL